MRSTPPANAPKANTQAVRAYMLSPQYHTDKAAAFASYSLERDTEESENLL